MRAEPGGAVVVVGSRRNLRPGGRFVRHVPVAIAIKSGHVPPHSLCLPLYPTSNVLVSFFLKKRNVSYFPF